MVLNEFQQLQYRVQGESTIKCVYLKTACQAQEQELEARVSSWVRTRAPPRRRVINHCSSQAARPQQSTLISTQVRLQKLQLRLCGASETSSGPGVRSGACQLLASSKRAYCSIHTRRPTVEIGTVKVPNFGPHGNFGPFILLAPWLLWIMYQKRTEPNLWIWRFSTTSILFICL
jgi:hypothetical protein